jgi:L-malate glycosyltransferase
MMLVHGLGIGGAEMMVCHLARHLRATGSSVRIGCLGELGELGEDLRADGFEVVLHARRPGFDPTLPVRVLRQLKRKRCDVIHAHQRTALFYGLLAGGFDAAPLVYTEHGPWFGPGPSRKKKLFNRLLGRRARRITAVAESVKRGLIEREGFASADIEIIPNGVDLKRFAGDASTRRLEARTRIDLPLQARVVGSVGRLEPVKNYAVLLRAFALLAALIPNAVLVLIGDGSERAALEERARTLGIADRVRFMGRRRDVEAILPAFDVFCLSSLAEGVPLTLLEAMAARVPVVASAAGGIPEAVRGGREAILVAGTPPDGRAALTDSGHDYVARFAAAVEQLLFDSEQCRRLAEQAYQRAADAFTLESVCRRYAATLEAVVRGSGAST